MSDNFDCLDSKQKSMLKRASNRKTSPEILKDKGIIFITANGGAHLIVSGRDCLIDFWPGTGKFIARNGKDGRGVFNLIKLCEVKND